MSIFLQISLCKVIEECIKKQSTNNLIMIDERNDMSLPRVAISIRTSCI